ncbi:hypothetical protein A2907_00295 [Candidatus Azambacteria bacterium RIFCSPLOWO2_01_FULL_37_9]|uniref:DUF1573 domain-containing protein n=1 Tax=Candidatus Azambacteria bacterium RIFCSPLOWO2_01_FULL_37_9 TaxID=1797297 RepID=A0A1F5C742_9BACT|nr:MAG: hypothetical protein US61_C0026G0004 [Parcubacteria group bacterium GW2011_GWE2_37_8]OGD38674.1 MAG: hypothetical protein A2907_00295 [Candidatus Azambacteria bacterium RIFCSPLOWO2_01_FULL_37_9]
MNKKIILYGVVIIVIVIFTGYFFGFGNSIKIFLGSQEESDKQFGPHLIIPVKEYNFGKIKQSGPIVSYEFEVANDGTEDVKIEKVLTSCNCTSAKIDKDIIKAGEKTFLTVEFDPNYHFESYDEIMRTATIFSNAINDPRPEVKIFTIVDYDLGVDKTKYGVDED